ncbi:MAG: hypothetical protein J6386_08430 [Candidatus Synoicihabitans palmerolidicus]|nr:hypothetical protein [Candidatus Synoicihabitans palmerolidicus]
MAVAHDFLYFGRDKYDGEAVLAEFGDQFLDFLFSAHVDAPSGLVEQEQARRGGKPTGQEHLLLVAAREGADRHFGARGFDAQSFDETVAKGGLVGRGERANGTLAGLQGDDVVVANHQVGQDALDLAILGAKRDTMAHGGAGIEGGETVCAESDGPSIQWVDTKEQANGLGATGPQ